MSDVSPQRLMPHQQKELEFLQTHPRALLLSETGTGKTISLLTYAGEYLAQGQRVLWITNAFLQDQLVKEAAKWLPADQQPKQIDKATDSDLFTYCTHELAAKRREELRKAESPFLLIVDEAAKVGGGGKDANMKGYLTIREISRSATRAVLATAEPLGTTHSLDLWALADCAGIPGLPDRMQMYAWVSWAEYFDKYNRSTRSPEGISSEGFNALLSAIKPHQHRTLLDSVESLPDIQRVHRCVELSGAAAYQYDKAQSVRGLEGHHLREQASRDPRSLVPVVIELLTETYAEHTSVLVFSDMFDLIDPLAAAFTASGLSHVRIDGQTTSKQRGKLIADHREGKAPYLLMTSAAEAGMNAQHASLLISVVQSYSPSRERQREGRIRRVGSAHAELVHVIVRPEVPHEYRRDEILSAKESLVAAMWKGLA